MDAASKTGANMMFCFAYEQHLIAYAATLARYLTQNCLKMALSIKYDRLSTDFRRQKKTAFDTET
jgi:hypothetical protein